MGIPHHLVSAKIAEARARGAFRRPTTDEARVLSEMERLLVSLADAQGKDALQLRARLALYERMLADIFERTGQSVLADVLYDVNPQYDAFC